MKKLIVIICVMSLFFVAGIASAQELLIQPKETEEESTVPSYEPLGNYFTEYELQYEAEMEKITDIFWKKELTKDMDSYLWLDDYGQAITTGIVLKDYHLLALSHEDVVAEVLNTIDKGYMYKLFTCYDNETGLCRSRIPPLEDFVRLPVSFLFSYYRADVMCFLARTNIFSDYGDYEYIYACTLYEL